MKNKKLTIGQKLKLLLAQSKAKKKKLSFTTRPELLLAPNVPKPLHKLAPRVILGASWWNKTRQEAYRSTDFHCAACGVEKYQAKGRQWLEGHEVYSIDYRKGTATYVETVPLCHFCHNYIHDGRMRALLQQGKLHQSKYIAIIQHGDRVLAEAGLQKMTYNARDSSLMTQLKKGKIARWEEWKLILFGKVYPTPYKSEAEWKEVHDQT